MAAGAGNLEMITNYGGGRVQIIDQSAELPRSGRL
jgi:hypothetical protein